MDDAFQQLLLRFSAAAAEGTSPPALIRLFCGQTRGFFQVDGVYVWQRGSGNELIGADADGVMAERFRGTRLTASQSAVAIEAFQQRKPVLKNRLDPNRYQMAAEYGARSIMAAPLVVGNEAIGAATFLHCSDPDFFNEDMAAKATILAGQLGSLPRRAGLHKSRGKNAGEPKFWWKWRRLFTLRLSRRRWLRHWRTGSGFCSAPVWFASCCGKPLDSTCERSLLNLPNWRLR